MNDYFMAMNAIALTFSPLALLMLFLMLESHGQEIIVEPYLQDATPESIHIMWETSEGGACKLKWGKTRDLGNLSERIFSIVNNRPSQIHRAPLEELTPSTTYFYQVSTGNAESDIYYFTTPPLAQEEKSFHLLALSDMQRDDEYPNKFKEIVEEGVLSHLSKESKGEDIFQDLGLVLIPGDLTKEGDVYTDWTNDFFRQSQKLLPYVPVYPVLGNHERNSDFYFNYFHLPDNGTSGYMEHWYYKDYGNVRIIGLNSNDNYRVQEQLDWLTTVLENAEQRDEIDFVFVQLHHPHKSELWIDGEKDYTGEVIFQLEKFSTKTGKPSIHFYGHTHGYSRGQSRDHAHLWVNVATAGGKIDGWGEYEQTNYEEFLVSHSDYGFVLVEVNDGDDPSFKLIRISRGDVANPKDNEVNDLIEVKRYGTKPITPTCVSPVNESEVKKKKVVLTASTFTTSDGSEHGETQWQVSRTYNFANPDIDIWKHYQDWYRGKDLNEGIDLTQMEIKDLREKTTYLWRVRYRTKGLTWSEWSEPQKFKTE
ncbi:MAG: metallophosphoesterase family protein [Bacteroidota bacterium]